MKVPARRHWRRSGVFIVNFGQVNVYWVSIKKERFSLEICQEEHVDCSGLLFGILIFLLSSSQEIKDDVPALLGNLQITMKELVELVRKFAGAHLR